MGEKSFLGEEQNAKETGSIDEMRQIYYNKKTAGQGNVFRNAVFCSYFIQRNTV